MLIGGAVLPPCELYGLRPPVLESEGCMVRLLATSERTHTNMCLHLPRLLLPVALSPWQATVDPHLHRRPSNTHRQFWVHQRGACNDLRGDLLLHSIVPLVHAFSPLLLSTFLTLTVILVIISLIDIVNL